MSNASTYGPAFFEGRSETVARSAQIVVPVLVDLFDPRSVLDVGCGKGEWLHAFDLEDTVGVDIAAPEKWRFVPHDLTKPLNLARYFDLVISLETGEHLPEDAAPTIWLESRRKTSLPFATWTKTLPPLR